MATIPNFTVNIDGLVTPKDPFEGIRNNPALKKNQDERAREHQKLFEELHRVISQPQVLSIDPAQFQYHQPPVQFLNLQPFVLPPALASAFSPISPVVAPTFQAFDVSALSYDFSRRINNDPQLSQIPNQAGRVACFEENPDLDPDLSKMADFVASCKADVILLLRVRNIEDGYGINASNQMNSLDFEEADTETLHQLATLVQWKTGVERQKHIFSRCGINPMTSVTHTEGMAVLFPKGWQLKTHTPNISGFDRNCRTFSLIDLSSNQHLITLWDSSARQRVNPLSALSNMPYPYTPQLKNRIIVITDNPNKDLSTHLSSKCLLLEQPKAVGNNGERQVGVHVFSTNALPALTPPALTMAPYQRAGNASAGPAQVPPAAIAAMPVVRQTSSNRCIAFLQRMCARIAALFKRLFC